MAREKSHSKEQISTFLNEINTQTDRGAAVIAASVLDDILKQLLFARLIKLSSDRRESMFERTGAPLSTFSSKIEMGFALGCYTNDIRLCLHLVRDIRNQFAHRMEQITFDHPEVAAMLTARALPSFKRQGRSTRGTYSDIFSVVAVMLYATLSGDIRLKSLEETHQAHFAAVTNKMIDVVREASAKQKVATPQSDQSPTKLT